MKFFIAGHSHLGTLMGGMEHLEHQHGKAPYDVEFLSMRAPEFEPWGTWVGPKVEFNPALIEAIETRLPAFDPEAVIVSIDGAHHFIVGTLNADPKVDFFDHVSEPTDPDAQLVPYHLVRSLFHVEALQVGRIVAHIRAATTAPIFFTAPPPPLRDSALMAPTLSVWADQIEKHGFASPELRMRFWRGYMAVLAEVAEGYGASFLYPPPQTLEEGGYLKPEYQLDSMHANRFYGVEMLAQVREEIAA